MKILLLGENRVVRELVKIAARELGARLECAANVEEIPADRYDLMLVDERTMDARRAADLGKRLLLGRILLLGSDGKEPLPEGIDGAIAKPFLPEEIVRAVETLTAGEEESEPGGEEAEGIYPDLESMLAREEPETEVLDPEEIARVKRLLEEDEVGGEKADTRMRPAGLAADLDADELIDLLSRLKSGKWRKVLRGAEVTLTIRFPDRDEA